MFVRKYTAAIACGSLALLAVSASRQLNFQTGFNNQVALAPLNMVPTDNMNWVPTDDSYIVMLKEIATESTANAVEARTENLNKHQDWLRATIDEFNVAESTSALFTSQVSEVYNYGNFQGYAGKFTPAVLTAIRANPDVQLVDQDCTVTLSRAVFHEFPEVVQSENVMETNKEFFTPPTTTTQTNATWGLHRISHDGSLPPRSRTGDLTYKFPYSEATDGHDVDVYIIDTGINIHHPEFQGRAVWGKTTAWLTNDEDNHGHGTHVAGTIGSLSYGIAKKSKLIAVKVLDDDGDGQLSWIISGIQHVVKSHRANGGTRKSVANMSLGGPNMPSVEGAASAAVEQGVVMVVAAGNSNMDACYISPAASEKVITVAASNINDVRADFSNWGTCVDIFAPGVEIMSTFINNSTHVASGTSMASPHVAGVVAALYTSMPAGSSVQQIKDKLFAKAERGVITDARGSPNLIARV